AIQHRVDVASGAELPATRLEANDIGSIEVSTETSLAVAPYIASRALGAFILIDRITNATVGAGMITHVSADEASTRWRPLSVGAEQRAALKHQRPCCIWLTASAGLDTRAIGELLERRLYADGCHTYRIDANDDRASPIGEIVRMMVDAGLILIVSAAGGAVVEQLRLSAPLRAEEFIEVRFGDGHVEPGAGTAREDARSSEPTRPIVVATARRSSAECVDELVRQLVDRAILLEHVGR
ncbi:MAG: elongation factor 1-alpha C-terminal domain-related protein, partial [Gemmatimonadaceae bacterium]